MAKCKHTVVRCWDPRLNEPIRLFLEKKGIAVDDYDLASIPGGPRDLLDNKRGLFRDFENVSQELHGVEKMVLIQHTDCGAYGGRAECGGTEEADFEFQKDQLCQASEVIKKAHPEVELLLVVAHIRDSGEVEFHELD